jgi:hypothetical protein
MSELVSNFCSVFRQPLSGITTQATIFQDRVKWKKSFAVELHIL